MVNELTKIIVKVGTKSNVKFSQCKLFRAVLADDLYKLHKTNEDCNIVIIESIAEDEQEAIKNFIIDFNNIDEQHNVLFFIPDNDDITSGIADELDYNICLTIDDLYKEIYKMYGINVSTFIDDKAKYNSVASETDIPGMDFSSLSSFEDIMGEKIDEQPNNKNSLTEVEVDNTNEDVYTNNKTEQVGVILDKAEEYTDDKSSDKELALIRELNDLKYEYKQVVKELKESSKEIENLENIIRAVTEEKNDIVNRYNSLTDSDIVEEPITLSEYETLKEQLANDDNIINTLKSDIDSLKSTIFNNEGLIKENNDTINRKNDTIEKLNDEIRELQAQIESGALTQNIVDEYSDKLNTVLNIRNSLMKEIKSILLKLVEANNKINNLETSLVESNELLGEYKEKIESTQEEIDNLNAESGNTINEISRLNSELEAANKRIEITNNYADTAKKEYDTKIAELETNLNVVKEQLEYKESQYRELIEQSKNSSNESITLANTNSSLDAMNKTLREKLGAANKELENLKANKIEMQNTINQYQGQVKRLTSALSSVTNQGNMGSVSVSTIQKALYSEKAKIMTVFGSGSFGITTTAMSLASKLCATSKVLYIDMDLVAPKADAWFSKNPICKNISGIPSNNSKMSALGIFYELGMETFMRYSASIIHQCDRTKGGGIDYLSGVYYRVEPSKIVEADYSSLFNFLGSMYQYIIIDLGRLGSSEVNDNLIKMLSDIATYNVVVTTSDKFELRNFRWKLNEIKINLDSIAWLINMSDKTAIDDRTKQYITPCRYGIMLNDPSLHGTREKFTRNKLNKDRLDLFANTALFVDRK